MAPGGSPGDAAGIAGYRLTGRSRAGELGTWYDAVSPDGTPVGVLRFAPGLVATPGATERIVAAVTADRRLQREGVDGLLPIVDLVAARGEVWLITGRPGMPAVTDLLVDRSAASAPDAGSAATVLVDSAGTLLAVHAAGLAHGALHSGTVVIGRDGSAVLAERGLAAGLRGETATPERDVAAWATLALDLSSGWAGQWPDAGELFHRAAMTARAQGLAAARDVLIGGQGVLPQGLATRDRLIETIHRWSAGQVPTGVPGLDAAGGGVAAGPGPGGGGDGEAVTLLALPEGGSAAPQRTDDVMRFGPGVPAETAAAQIWRSGRDQQTTVAGRDRPRGPRPRRRGRRTAWSAAVSALIVTGLILAWLLIPRGDAPPLAVTGVQVRGPSKTIGCDKTAGFIGVITTNGQAGEVRYQWRQSDGHRNKAQVQTVAQGQKSTRVPLKWNVTGPGTRKFTATLRVLSPVTSEEPLEAKASFTYKC